MWKQSCPAGRRGARGSGSRTTGLRCTSALVFVICCCCCCCDSCGAAFANPAYALPRSANAAELGGSISDSDVRLRSALRKLGLWLIAESEQRPPPPPQPGKYGWSSRFSDSDAELEYLLSSLSERAESETSVARPWKKSLSKISDLPYPRKPPSGPDE